ncbi:MULTISPECIES: IclR family transcriptional regulator [unclassified Luteococcus]|uniref:IclR family transcriptional regulator n=1 Tax=unclassified Luteococcus TaxID=2639923 RepID=UPI00313AFE5B
MPTGLGSTSGDANKSRDSRTAVDKAFALLAAFDGDPTVGVGVSELARRARLSKSTAFRLLGMLERNGAVERDASNYRLGPALQDLASPMPMPEVDLVRDSLTPFLAHLYERTRQTVHLAVLDGPNVVFLNKLHGLQYVAMPTRIGARLPAYCSAAGKVMLAHDPLLANQVLAGELTALTPHTVTSPVRLRAELERIRMEGIAYSREELMVGLDSVGCAVTSPSGAAVAALCVSGPVNRFNPRTQAPVLRQVCGEASKAYTLRLRAARRG